MSVGTAGKRHDDASARRIAVVGYHDPYHDAHSGYEHFHPFVGAEWIDVHGQLERRAPVVGRLYGRVMAERHLRAVLRGFDLAHFIYPEAHLLFSHRATASLRSVVTLHLPFDWYFGTPRDGVRLWAINRGLVRALRQCAGVILLDDLELDRWRAALPQAKFAVIPHGVADHGGWFEPQPAIGSTRSITVIGRNCRDWAMLDRVLAIAAAERPEWRFHLVGVRAMAEQLAGRLPNVIAHPRLAHDDYMRLLAGSDANFLPVTFASANNALLEAHSVGVPSVMTDTGGARRYALGTTELFRDEADAIRGIDAVVNGHDRLARRAATRAESHRFFWSSLAPQFREFYRSVEDA